MEKYWGYVLALHIIFIVTWFAGLFYIVRLFIYHTEAEQKLRNQNKAFPDIASPDGTANHISLPQP